MPGLVGLAQLSGAPVDVALFQRLCQNLADRPNYRIDCVSHRDWSLASGRVHKGIINPQRQPARSPDDRILLFMDGEVFNEDLDLNDQANAVLKAYLAEGRDLFKRLNGSFALALLEPESRRLTLVVDRLASIPIFYTRCGTILGFCSQLRPLTLLPGFAPKINPLALENFLTTGFLLDGVTLLEGVNSLGCGELLTVENGEAQIENYYRFSFASQRDRRPPAELETELSEILFRAVRRQLGGPHKMALTLSGGYDSRSILYYMHMADPERSIQTITWGMDRGLSSSDLEIARALSQRLNTDHHFFPLNADGLPDHFRTYVQLDEGRTDAVGNYPEALGVFERIREELGVEVLLRGNEIFGARRKAYSKKDAMHVAFLDDLSSYPHSFRYIKPHIYRKLSDLGREQMRSLHARCPYPDHVDRKDYFYITQRNPGYQTPLSQLKRHVIEERNPFMDNEVMDFISRTPSHLRIWKNLFMSTVRNQVPGFTDIEISRTINLVDWDDRLRRDAKLQSFTRRILLEERNGFDDIFDRKKLEAFLEDGFKIREQKNRSLIEKASRRLQNRLGRYELDFNQEVFRLMILKIWVDEFMGGNFQMD